MGIPAFVFYAIALAALAGTSAMYARKRKALSEPLRPSSWAWTAPFALALVFLVVWDARGLVDVSTAPIAAPMTALVIFAGGACALRRDIVWKWYDRRGKATRVTLCVALALTVVLLSTLVIEVPFNELLPFEGPSHFWLEALLVGLLILGLYFLCQRHAVLCLVGLALCFVTGIGQYFIKSFKNAAILPSDLLALGTAAAVSKEYVYSLNERALEGIALTLLCVCALSLVRPPQRSEGTLPFGRTIAINTGAAVASLSLLVGLIFVPSYVNDFKLKLEYWYTMDYCQLQGFYPSFITVLQDMPIRAPEGYTDQAAMSIEEQHAQSYYAATSTDEAHKAASAQFESQKPAVVVVMNEAFSDLSTFDGMHAGYEGPEFFNNGFNDALARGTLYVSVNGGGTCNSEFEFLTGDAMSFIGIGKYPYSIYDFAHVDALAMQFRDLGYHTHAIHPNYASNWNRDEIYVHMGFDEFLSIDDFGGTPNCEVDKVTPNDPHCEVFHSGVSDRDTYSRVLQILKEDSSPQFIFDVTMANHGSYDQNNIDPEYLTDYTPTDYVGDETPEALNEYLACIKRADKDLEEFVSELRTLDRPVVLVFFGDHQPTLSKSYNDYWYEDEPEGEHARRAFCTSYVIWANYDVDGREQNGTSKETSVDMLASKTLDLIGAPVTDFQAAKLDIQRLIPSLSVIDYMGDDLEWHAPGTSEKYDKAYTDLSYIEYLNFATKV